MNKTFPESGYVIRYKLKRIRRMMKKYNIIYTIKGKLTIIEDTKCNIVLQNLINGEFK